MKRLLFTAVGVLVLASVMSAQSAKSASVKEGRRLFEQGTFGGNGRTCLTCHSQATGTLSPADVAKVFKKNPGDVLFVHDGSDDGLGDGVSRILKDATVLVTIPLPANVTLADDPSARSVTLRRAIASTLNTPALDPVLMLDGRQPSLEAQAAGAIHDHAQGILPSPAELHSIAEFQKSDNAFFSSPAMRMFASGGPAPLLPPGTTASEKRGRRFFEDVPPNPADVFTSGLCSHCHSGPLLNVTNRFAADFIGLPVPAGERFFGVAVSEFNALDNPVHEYVFDGGTPNEFHVVSPDPGRALITGISGLHVPDFDPVANLTNVNAFKISPLRGIRFTAPYFHDNSAKTLDDVAAHYANFFAFVTGGAIVLTPQDQQDMVAYMKLLD